MVEIRKNIFVSEELAASLHLLDYRAAQRVEETLAEQKAWLDTPEAKLSPEYSDIFKDVYGFRPI